jgi:hypothetical protein
MRTDASPATFAGRFAALLFLALPGPAVAQPPPPAEMQAAHQVQRDAGEREGRLDTAVFIDLSPVTAAEPAVRLPDDQRDEPASRHTEPPR